MTLEETLQYVNNKDKINYIYSLPNIEDNAKDDLKYFIRKQGLYDIVYLWLNKLNGKPYVGSATNPYDRFCNFTNWGTKYAGYKIQEARKKTTLNDWSYYILEKVDIDKHTLEERENYYINLFEAISKGYNIRLNSEYSYLLKEYIKKAKYFIDTLNHNQLAYDSTITIESIAMLLKEKGGNIENLNINYTFETKPDHVFTLKNLTFVPGKVNHLLSTNIHVKAFGKNKPYPSSLVYKNSTGLFKNLIGENKSYTDELTAVQTSLLNSYNIFRNKIERDFSDVDEYIVSKLLSYTLDEFISIKYYDSQHLLEYLNDLKQHHTSLINETEKPILWGGKREGAGRHKKDVCQKLMSLRLDADLALVFDTHIGIKKNTYINNAVREMMKQEGFI